MWLLTAHILGVVTVARACLPSVTTVSGSYAPSIICSGDLVFSDDFDEFDLEKWQHEITLSGGGNFEFQYYSNNRTNSFTRNSSLHIRPSLTSEHYGEAFLTSGRLDVDGATPADRCTNSRWWGCDRTGNPTFILNPIKSARIRTVNSFNFRYGRVEIRAKMPAGDWLWPALWLIPTTDAYGSWPASGEIDILEARGNRELFKNGVNIGTKEASFALQYGPYGALNRWDTAHGLLHDTEGYDKKFHLYKLEWTPDYIRASIDDKEMGKVTPPSGGFWEYGGFTNMSINNPWKYGTKMAPFDQKFFIVVNLAVGGINGYFPDDATNPKPKPWLNSAQAAATDFWKKKNDWLPTWKLDENEGEEASLQVDYVRVWAL